MSFSSTPDAIESINDFSDCAILVAFRVTKVVFPDEESFFISFRYHRSCLLNQHIQIHTRYILENAVYTAMLYFTDNIILIRILLIHDFTIETTRTELFIIYYCLVQ